MIDCSARSCPSCRPEVLSFLDAIKDTPDDDTPRLILADWLDDHDDETRAEFIRVQCQLVRLPRRHPERDEADFRECVLRNRHEDEWLGPLRPLAQRWAFDRGLLGVRLCADHLLEAPANAPEWQAAWAWVDTVELRCREGELRRLLHTSWLGQLTALVLEANDLGPGAAVALAAAPAVARLTYLILGSNHIGARGAQVLAAAPYLSRLTELGLWYNRIGDAGARALANSPVLARLTILHLQGNQIGPDGARALASSPYLRGLTRLDMWNNPLGEEGAAVLRARFGHAVCF